MAATPRWTAALALALTLALGGAATAGNLKVQTAFGGNFFDVQPPCKTNQFPTFETISPVPAILDPFAQDLVPVFCDIQVTKNGQGVKGVKAKYSSELIVIDNVTGQAQTFGLGSGTAKTDAGGFAHFDFDIPSDLFADGFESGDVSAWSYTRTDFKKKKADSAAIACQTPATGQ